MKPKNYNSKRTFASPIGNVGSIGMFWVMLIAIAGLTLTQSAFGQGGVKVPFMMRHHPTDVPNGIFTIKGDFHIIGNTNLLGIASGDNGAGTNFDFRFVDVDNDDSTFNSSTAELVLANKAALDCNPSKIKYAGLYWTGRGDYKVLADPLSATKTQRTESFPKPPTKYYYWTRANLNGVTNTSYYRLYYNDQNLTNPYAYVYLTSPNGNPYISKSTPPGAAGTSSWGGGSTKYYYSTSTIWKQQTSTWTPVEKGHVLLKGPGATSYFPLDAAPADRWTLGTKQQYVCFVDVTPYVKAHGVGNYTVANIKTQEGSGGDIGDYAGWGMVIVYEDPDEITRNITIFDGFADLDPNGTSGYAFKIDGFKSVLSGPVSLKLGVMAGEGDSSIVHDWFNVAYKTSLDNFTTDYLVSNPPNANNSLWYYIPNPYNHDPDNFFCSSIYTEGNRIPRMGDNAGMDADEFLLDNSNKQLMGNAQTKTVFSYRANTDEIVVFMVAMSVDAYTPEPILVFNNNATIVGGNPQVNPGDQIQYDLKITNIGTESIDSFFVKIPIPYNTSYVNGSLSGAFYLPNGTCYQPNSMIYNPALHQIEISMKHLPGPNDKTGSCTFNPPIANWDSTYIWADATFKLRATDSCVFLNNECARDIKLIGYVSGIGTLSGTRFNATSVNGWTIPSGLCKSKPIYGPDTVAIHVNGFCEGKPDYIMINFCPGKYPTGIPLAQIISKLPDNTYSFYAADATWKKTGSELSVLDGVNGGNYLAIPVNKFDTLCDAAIKIKITIIQPPKPKDNGDKVYCMGDESISWFNVVEATNGNELYFSELDGTPVAYSNLMDMTKVIPSPGSSFTKTYVVTQSKDPSCVSDTIHVSITITYHDPTLVDILADTKTCGSLRWCTRMAPDGSTITFAPGLPQKGTISLNSSFGPIPISNKNLTIDGSALVLPVMDGQNAIRLFDIISTDCASPKSVTFKNLALANGKTTVTGLAGRGGSIHNAGNLTLINCELYNNKDITVNTGSQYGGAGALFSECGNVSLQNCYVHNNSAEGTSNSASDGAYGASGAMSVINGNLTITKSTISNNSITGTSTATGQTEAYGSAGAIMVKALPTNNVTIINSTVSDNTIAVSADGGSRLNPGSPATADKSVGAAGAMMIIDDGTVTVKSSTLFNNCILGSGNDNDNTSRLTSTGGICLAAAGSIAFGGNIMADNHAKTETGGDYMIDLRIIDGISITDLFTRLGYNVFNGGTKMGDGLPETSYGATEYYFNHSSSEVLSNTLSGFNVTASKLTAPTDSLIYGSPALTFVPKPTWGPADDERDVVRPTPTTDAAFDAGAYEYTNYTDQAVSLLKNCGSSNTEAVLTWQRDNRSGDGTVVFIAPKNVPQSKLPMLHMLTEGAAMTAGTNLASPGSSFKIGTAPNDTTWYCVQFGKTGETTVSGSTVRNNVTITGLTPSVDYTAYVLTFKNNGGVYQYNVKSATNYLAFNASAEAPPVITCNSDATIYMDESENGCSKALSFTAPAAYDPCDGNKTLTPHWELSGATSGSGNGNISNVVFNTGETTITWTATGIGVGRTASCTQKITLYSGKLPVVVGGSITNETVNVASDQCSATVVKQYTFDDACTADNTLDIRLTVNGVAQSPDAGTSAPNPKFTLSIPDYGTNLPFGTYNLVWTVKNTAQKEATFNQTIVIKDAHNPVINGLPSSQTITREDSVCGGYYTAPDVTTTDCNGPVTLTWQIINNSVVLWSGNDNMGKHLLPEGDNILRWTATDNAGNVTTSPDIIITVPAVTYVNRDRIYVRQGWCSDGRDWAHAMGDLQHAINLANKEVWVACGEYDASDYGNNGYLLKDGLKIYGGFRPYPNDAIDNDIKYRNPIYRPTRLRQSSTATMPILKSPATVEQGIKVNGFFIEGNGPGTINYGAADLISGVSLEYSVVLLNNTATRPVINCNGGQVINSLIGKNGSTSAILNLTGTGAMHFSTLVENEGTGVNGDGTITNSIIYNNTVQVNGLLNISYSGVQDLNGTTYGPTTNNNIALDPVNDHTWGPNFGDAPNYSSDDYYRGYWLNLFSKLKAAGDNSKVAALGLTADLKLSQRIKGRNVDMGAFESRYLLTEPSDISWSGNTVNLTWPTTAQQINPEKKDFVLLDPGSHLKLMGDVDIDGLIFNEGKDGALSGELGYGTTGVASVYSGSNTLNVDNVYYARRFAPNKWHFIYLPFDVSTTGGVLDSLMNPLPFNVSGGFSVREYDGIRRSSEGSLYNQPSKNWSYLDVNNGMTKYKGYNFAVLPDERLVYFKSLDNNGNRDFLNDQPKSLLMSYKSLSLSNSGTGGGNDGDQGWNLVGIPYSSYYKIKGNVLLPQWPYETKNFWPFNVVYWKSDETTYDKYIPTVVNLETNAKAFSPFTPMFIEIPDTVPFKWNTDYQLQPEGRQDISKADILNTDNVYQARSVTVGDPLLFALNIKKANYSDRALIVLNADASKSFEVGRDMGKFGSSNTKLPQLSMIVDGKALCINDIPEDPGVTRVPLNVYIGEEGFYRINLENNPSIAASGYSVVLEDTYTNAANVIDGTDYEFTSSTGTFSNRFVLNIVKSATAVVTPVGSLWMYVNNDQLTIKGLEAGNRIEIFDVTGRMLYTSVAQKDTEIFGLSQKGVYFVKVYQSTGTVSKKVINE
ncbi:T9SS type A sorting domain-containing protein [Parabacteroides sp. FAFU027]|uniref:T9SS type A sorting domain-containing protein n=1 Tax=Parabacteroides sp. FAFU027 TaxID=2922715 RepID=UPI001FAEF31C|nr:T9SS type A sorting domain-containing protein [Parabacteroides sp. FAFU027]